MILSLLVIFFFVSAIASGRSKKIDKYLAYAITFFLIILAADFSGNRDRTQYDLMIQQHQNQPFPSVEYLLISRIDPFFFVVVLFASKFSEDPYWVYLIYAVCGFMPKLWITAYFPRYRAFIISSYALFLSPALEFAAIRAAVALSIFPVALIASRYFYRVAAVVIASSAHISGAFSAVGLLGKIKKKSTFRIYALLFGTAVFSYFSTNYIGELGRAGIYIGNVGTTNAFFSR